MTHRSPRPAGEIADRLHEAGVIPVVRVATPAAAFGVTDALVAAGVGIVEITLTTPGAIGVIDIIARRFGHRVVVGAGTVTDPADARAAIEAGAEFVVSPCVIPDLITRARPSGVLVIPGALTPTEVFGAMSAGAEVIKIFPAHHAGGPAYLRALRGPFPHARLVPTGGVTLDTVGAYIREGAVAVGVGGELIAPDALERGDYDAIGALAERFVAAVRAARRS